MNQDGEFQLLKIGELAALAGISVKALRVYEKKNIIKPVRVDEGSGYRYYSAGHTLQIPTNSFANTSTLRLFPRCHASKSLKVSTPNTR